MHPHPRCHPGQRGKCVHVDQGALLLTNPRLLVETCIAPATTKLGNSSIVEYVGNMKALRDETASSEKKLDDEDMCRISLPSSTLTITPSC